MPIKSTETAFDVGHDIAGLAIQFLGQPYVWGGKSPEVGFDCSGLVYWCYHVHGIELPTWAKWQYDYVRKIDESEAKVGDLVFFIDTYDMVAVHGSWVQPPYISHVGIYLGYGTMINANSSGIIINDINDSYWSRHFYGFGTAINR